MPDLRRGATLISRFVIVGGGGIRSRRRRGWLLRGHVNTMEGFWSLLRSWLRPHRGISQEKLPIYLGFFKFVHNARKRDKDLLNGLLGILLG